MRLPVPILLAAAALAALTAAAAQEAPPAAQPAEAAKAEPTKAEPGLSDLSATVETLQDMPPPAETPAETPLDEPEPLRGQRIEPPAVSTVVPVGPDGQPLPPAEEAAPEPAPEQAQPATPPAETPAPPSIPPGERFVEPLTRAQLDQLAATAARGRLLGAIAATGQIATRRHAEPRRRSGRRRHRRLDCRAGRQWRHRHLLCRAAGRGAAHDRLPRHHPRRPGGLARRLPRARRPAAAQSPPGAHGRGPHRRRGAGASPLRRRSVQLFRGPAGERRGAGRRLPVQPADGARPLSRGRPFPLDGGGRRHDRRDPRLHQCLPRRRGARGRRPAPARRRSPSPI